MSFSNVVMAFRLHLTLLWWKICRFFLHLFTIQSIKPASQFFHKVVIIGDDFAAGVGDYMTLGSRGGMAAYLQPIINKDDKVRHNWEIINAGVPGSVSEDWKLNSKKNYFNKVFTSRSMGDASIVIVMVGSLELRNESADIFKIKRNLTEICDTLRKKGKKVCLATAANPHPLTAGAEVHQLTTALEELCKSTSTDDIPIILGPRLDNYAFRRENALLYDNYHFNSSSYRLLARNTADFLIPMMTAVEWTTWKEQLNRVTYDKALYD